MEERSPRETQHSSPVFAKSRFFEEEGSSRAVTSGSITMVFALIGSSCIWIFLVIATDWEGLRYFGLTAAINGIIGIFAIGFSRYFIAEIKESLILNEESARLKAASYCKILFLIAICLSFGLFILSLITTNTLLKVCYFACSFSTIIVYLRSILQIGLEIKNRYDIIAFVSIFGGINLLLFGIIFITYDLNPQIFAFHPFFNLMGILLLFYFFQKFSPFSLREVLTARTSTKGLMKKASKEALDHIKSRQIMRFFKYSTYSTITNIESFGIFGNLLIYFAALYISLFRPEYQAIAVSLLTILMVYGAVRSVILYYAAPLNIEIAEACTKKCRETIQDSVNESLRISSLLAFGFIVGMIAISDKLLLLLHGGFFSQYGQFDGKLFLSAQILFTLIIIGQFSYGYSTLFGNALIGSGNSKYAALGFGLTLMIIIICSPIVLFFFPLIGVGIVMVTSISFLLPFMYFQLKKRLQIEFNTRIYRLIPNLLILYIILGVIPFNGALDMIIRIIIAAVIYMVLNPFFGASSPKDIKMIHDLTSALKIGKVGDFFVIMLKFAYNISPFNKDKIREL